MLIVLCRSGKFITHSSWLYAEKWKKVKICQARHRFPCTIGVWYCLWSMALNVKTDTTQIWVVAGVENCNGIIRFFVKYVVQDWRLYIHTRRQTNIPSPFVYINRALCSYATADIYYWMFWCGWTYMLFLINIYWGMSHICKSY